MITARVADAPDGASADARRGADGARRAEILRAAATIFASSGYVGTSLKDIADACGILPGSLYHHFDSKESIVIELIERYQAELDEVGRQALAEYGRESGDLYCELIGLGVRVALCGARNRAAVQLLSYEPHAGASDELVALSRRAPRTIDDALDLLINNAQTAGVIKPDIDSEILRVHVNEMMRHVAMGSLHADDPAEPVAVAMCHMLLDGVAVDAPTDAQLDDSEAMRAARASARVWNDPGAMHPDNKSANLVSVARAEFARRGYEATTIRDIASAAGMGTGSVYRFVESKEALLAEIMGSFHATLSQGYKDVLASDSTVVGKLDALAWLNISVLGRFSEEFEIQRAWMRSTPPSLNALSVAQRQRAKLVRTLVAEGFKNGELRVGNLAGRTPSMDLVARCFRDLLWTPILLVRRLEEPATLSHVRETFLRGASA